MDSLAQRRYVHRPRKDGTFDSICLQCMGTAVYSKPETELKECEDRHVCDPVMLYEMTRIFQKYRPV